MSEMRTKLSLAKAAPICEFRLDRFPNYFTYKDMVKSLTVEAARNFLETVWNDDPPSDAVLIAALDRLLMAYHETPNPAELKVSDAEPPEHDWKTVQFDVAKRFPDYGFYAVADPLNLDGTSTMMTGDAIDDIADISKEMRNTVWYADQVDVDNAHWHFRMLYLHWGQHARQLANYLFTRQFR